MPFTPTQTRSQYAAIAWLRWRILANSFRRKGGAGEIVARVLIWPIFAGMALGPTILAAFAAYWFASNNHLDRVAWVLWANFILCQLLNIQLGQPGTTFDPTQLIRFPLALRSYTAIRLFFGLLSPANIIGALIALATALGVTLAIPGLWLASLLACLIFAATNALFSRMVFAWVDRWLSTRRAREVFTAIIFTASLGFQYLNFTFNPAYNRHRTITDPSAKISAAATFYHRAEPFLHVFPPNLTASSLVAIHTGQPLAFLGYTSACALFALTFLAVFTLRMKTEFRGESLSDAANAVPKPSQKSRTSTPDESLSSPTQSAPFATPQTLSSRPEAAPFATPQTLSSRPEAAPFAAAAERPASLAPANKATNQLFPPVLSALLAKEVLFLRRNTGIFYAVIAPIVFVFLFAGRLASRTSGASWIFPVAVAYTLLGITPLAYNSFGYEAAGAQFYFLAPIRFRDVFLAKNLLNFGLSLLEIVAVFAIITYSTTAPSLRISATALLWAAATILVSTAVGNRRSLSAPKLIPPGRTSRQQANGLSALIGMGIFLLSASAAGGLLVLSTFFHFEWVLIPTFATLFAAALSFYLLSLGKLDRFALDHREKLFEELCKKA